MAKGQIKQKQTSEVITKLEYAFSMGCTVVDACTIGGIGETTYYRWCGEDEALRGRFQLLQGTQILKARVIIDDALNSGDLATAKWLLERKCKREFSTLVNQEIEGKPQVTEIRKVIISHNRM